MREAQGDCRHGSMHEQDWVNTGEKLWSGLPQVAMAYPLVGKSRRPMTLLLAWRMKDMLDEMDRFCMEHDIMPRHETLDVARIACEEYDTDVHGQYVSYLVTPSMLTG